MRRARPAIAVHEQSPSMRRLGTRVRDAGDAAVMVDGAARRGVALGEIAGALSTNGRARGTDRRALCLHDDEVFAAELPRGAYRVALRRSDLLRARTLVATPQGCKHRYSNPDAGAFPPQIPMATTLSPGPTQPDSTKVISPLDDEVLAPLAELVRAWYRGEDPEIDAALQALAQFTDPVQVVARTRGLRQAERWAKSDEGALPAIRATIAEIREKAAAGAFLAPDLIQIEVTFGYETVNLSVLQVRRQLGGLALRGLLGMEMDADGVVERVSSSSVITSNRHLAKSLEMFLAARAIGMEDIKTRNVNGRVFKGIQLLVELNGAAPAEPLFRGNIVVDIQEINRTLVEDLEKQLGDYLFRSVQKDGRMLYLYYPSRGVEDSVKNNQIRQWMATVAMIRTARHRGDDAALYKKAEENIRYNLRNFYSVTGKFGMINEGSKVKLGAVALALLSLIEHPKRAQFKRQEEKLIATIDYLFQPDGSFRTFFKPPNRNDVQNFYPGEALLAWAFLYEESRDPVLLEKFMRAFRYYREWHRQQPNPAFIPWHTQAYYKVFLITGEQELADFIFEMSDWLLPMQEWGSDLPIDTLGRFYDPRHPEYGPPHASSTGVYMEGLIDAFALARKLGDAARAEEYRLVLLRALRDCRQLSFRDDRDMFYVSKRDFLRGGLRTTIYDNQVRVDNVQHNQMAILKILAEFKEEDFIHPPVE